MKKLYCIIEDKINQNDPIINGRKPRELIIQESKDISTQEVQRLETAINRLSRIVEDAYRIFAVFEASKEYNETLKSLKSDNTQALLELDRRFRSYALEFDMFLDYWQAIITHHKRIDGSSNEEHTSGYKQLFENLTNNAYNNHIEYKLLDMIRNVTAHVQSPVNHIHIGLEGNEAYANRDVLLEKCKNGENKKNILRAQPEKIKLTPIVNVTIKCLEEIHDGLIDYELDDLAIEECKVLNLFIQNANSKGMLYKPWVIMDKEALGKGVYHIHDIPMYLYLLGRIQKNKTM